MWCCEDRPETDGDPKVEEMATIDLRDGLRDKLRSLAFVICVQNIAQLPPRHKHPLTEH